MTMRTTGVGLAMVVLVGCGGAGYRTDPSAPATAPASEAPAAAAPAAERASDVAMIDSAAAPAAAKAASASGAADRPIEVARPARPAAGQLTAGVWDDNLNFSFFGPYANEQRQRGAGLEMFDAAEMMRARDLALGLQSAKTQLDVQLLLDTTGSMGDELSYLQSEFDSIAATLGRKFPYVTPRWSLVVYRDRGDDYVTRQFDFTSDPARFRTDLRAQDAGGGGDFPEAVVDAWRVGLQQKWRSESNVAKVAFWVADAPTHDGEGKQLAGLVREASQRGVHVYPIASSGVDEIAEYQMRSAAQRTGGRYVFLTDDSGVGNSHAEPHIPCYNVAKLDTTIVRMIETELVGQHVRLADGDVVRTVGNPDRDGKCQLQSKAIVASY